MAFSLVTTITTLCSLSLLAAGVRPGYVLDVTNSNVHTILPLLDRDSVPIEIPHASPSILRDFANTNVSVTIKLTNEQAAAIKDRAAAEQLLLELVTPFLPATSIRAIRVGDARVSCDAASAAKTAAAVGLLEAALDSLQLVGITIVSGADPSSTSSTAPSPFALPRDPYGGGGHRRPLTPGALAGVVIATAVVAGGLGLAVGARSSKKTFTIIE